jgi:hypothetical protein
MALPGRRLTPPAAPAGGCSAMVAPAGTVTRLVLPEVTAVLADFWATVDPAGPVAPPQLVAPVAPVAC